MRPKILIICLLAGMLLMPELVYADSCPHCGRAYGPAKPGDEMRVNALRSAHEANCPARHKDRIPDGTIVFRNMTAATSAYSEACRKLAELNRVVQELSGWPKAVYESLSPEERTSVEKALAAMTERYLSAMAHNEALESRVRRMQMELTNLQMQLVERSRDVAHIQATVEMGQANEQELRQQLKAVDSELSVAGSALELLKRIAMRKADGATRARERFWDTVGDLFKNEDLGLPRDYLAAIEAGPVITLRRRKVVKEQATVSVRKPVLTMPVISGVRSRFTSPLVRLEPSPASLAGPLNPTGENLKLRIDHLLEQSLQCRRLNQRVQDLLIESDRAKWQFKQSIARERQLKQQDSLLKAGIDELREKLGFARWELGVRSNKAKSYILDSFQDWQQEQRWGVLQKVFDKLLYDEKLSSAIHNELLFAHDIVQGDLSSLPAVLATGDSRDFDELSARVEARFDDFVKSTYDIEDDPLSDSLNWIKGLVDIMKGQ